MVVSWICVVCIFIIVANLLKIMYHFLFRESKPMAKTSLRRERDFHKVYENALYEQEIQATGTEGRKNYSVAKKNTTPTYSSYEEYRRNNRISR